MEPTHPTPSLTRRRGGVAVLSKAQQQNVQHVILGLDWRCLGKPAHHAVVRNAEHKPEAKEL